MVLLSRLSIIRCAVVVAVLSMPAELVSSANAVPKKQPTRSSRVSSPPSRPVSKIPGSISPVAVRSFDDRNEILVSTRSKSPKFSISQLSAPSRLVIDLEGEKLPAGASLRSSGLPFISGVRVGAHPAKTRIVVDLKGSTKLAHSTHIEGTTLVVKLSPQAPALATKASKDIPETRGKAESEVVQAASPVMRRAALSLDEEVVVSGSSSTSVSPTSLAVSKVAQAQKAAAAQPIDSIVTQLQSATTQPVVESGPSLAAAHVQELPHEAKAGLDVEQSSTQGGVPTRRVSSVVLEANGKASPAVVVGIKGAPDYAISRTAPSEYVLTLRNTIADDATLKNTLFTSQASSGIRSVRTTREGDDTLVRIFTQPSSYLTTRQVGEQLRVEETQDLARIARDIRAQMAPAGDTQAKDDAGTKTNAAKPTVASVSASPKSEGSAKKESKTDSATGKSAAKKGESGVSERELAAITGNSTTYTGRLISLDLQDADIDSALRIIAEVSSLNIVAGDGVAGKVTLKLVDVPWDQALDVILKSQGLDKVLEGNVLRVAPVDKLKQERESFKQARVAEEELEPLSVKYIRISYAKASEIKALVETVVSERGNVAFDERSNQLVVKDVRKGLQNVTELIKKVDLRTPQILLETQIIEASRNLSRQLGSELGFQYIQSPATGNGTGLNFPAAIAVGGSADPSTAGSITGAAFPVASSATLGSAVTMLFDSADGTKSLSLRLSQLEQEGQVKIISKPAVATTNNKPAEIKSVEKFRVKLPNGGLSIATGSGAQSSGSGDIATQTIEAGIVLNVTPQASPDYYILLDIKAKSSSFGAKSVDGIPNEIERSASSSVLVSSGQTFALGGIYKISERDSVSGVPFFKDIPVLGTFFRSMTTENSDEELLFFITPRIVEGSFEDASMKVNS